MTTRNRSNTFLQRYLDSISHGSESSANSEPSASTKSTNKPIEITTETKKELESILDDMSAAEILPLLQTILSRLDKIENKMSTSEAAGSGGLVGGGAAAELPRAIRGFDSYTASFLDPFVAAASKLGGDAATIGTLTKDCFMELRAFLLKASACKEPAQAALPGLLAGLAAKMKLVSGAVNRNEWEKHTKTVSEGLGALNWYLRLFRRSLHV
jgi:hypothetical protein